MDWRLGLNSEIAPRQAVSVRESFQQVLDDLLLGLAVAGAQDDPAMLNPEYAEGMVLVFDEYLSRQRRHSSRRITI
jgi:hypothetical protein